ncbi:MAG: hypothetical protein PUC46_09595, partial [Lachnospiraceae bacterium]|nr:hypothetical protein [Lachnospiraceae bacterium]
QKIVFPVINYYPGFTVTDKTGGARLADHMDNNQVTIQLSPEYSGALSIAFEAPLHWHICELISFLAVCGTVLIIIKRVSSDS